VLVDLENLEPARDCLVEAEVSTDEPCGQSGRIVSPAKEHGSPSSNGRDFSDVVSVFM